MTDIDGPNETALFGDLDRFVTAQEPVYDGVLRELHRGHKTSHWMWFVFPQVAGLGRSEMSRRFGIAGLAEARAYLSHAVLGSRLRQCAAIVAGSTSVTAEAIFGSIDAVKLRSSMTLFHRAEPGETVFFQVLARYFDGVVDPATDALLGLSAPHRDWHGS